MWGSFNCPHCHKLLRVRRNFGLRILRLALIVAAAILLAECISDWVRRHAPIAFSIDITVVGLIEEWILRFLLPTKIEPAAPGSLASA